MSILSKLQSLLTAANTATGESDTTITEAMQTLIDGYGQGGEPSYSWQKIGEYTVTENIRTITINATEEMLSAIALRFNVQFTLTASDYIYCALNNPSTSNRSFTSSVSTFNGFWRVDEIPNFDDGISYLLILPNYGGGGQYALNYASFTNINFMTYTSTKFFAPNSKIEIWGYMET